MNRFFCLILLAAAILTGCSHDELTLITGSYNAPDEAGLRSFRFNQETGEAVLLDSIVTRNPSYLCPSKNGKSVYAVCELTDPEFAAVSAFSFKKKDGSFKLLNTVPAVGADPCYISTNGKIVVTANYTLGSVAVFPIGRRGKLKECSQAFEGVTGGPDSLRQGVPHAHCALFSPDGKYLYSTDFSADRIRQFSVVDKGLEPTCDALGDAISYAVQPGEGPRHLVFSPGGKGLYVIGELSGAVNFFDYEKTDGSLVPRQHILSDPYDGHGAADIRISPDGKFLYASNRLVNDGITVFRISKNGLLEQVAHQATRVHPRNFVITPNGKYLLCACRDSNMIQVFLRDKKTGLLTDTGLNIMLPNPVCIRIIS